MKAKFLRFWLGQVVLGLLVSCIALLDPFGLSSSSDAASAQWINRITASNYPGKGQDQVVVILIDDAYLMHNDTFWPLPYAQQSTLFKRLLAYKPKAVFVDLMYSHDHGGPDRGEGSQLLANVFERYQRQGIALLLANTGEIRGQDGQANAMANLTSLTRPSLVKWSDLGDKYPLAVDTQVGVLETPALGLYREYCKNQQCAGLPGTATAAAEAPPIALRWGRALSPLQSQATSISRCSVSGNAWYAQLWQAIFWKFGDSGQASCAYTLTLKASALEASSTQDRALLTQMLSNKLVLVGAEITSAGDLVQTPVHGLLPGVYLHAMALDNLITYNMNYEREPASYSWLSITWLDCVQVLMVALILGLRTRLKRRAKRLAHGWNSPILSWAMVQLLLAALCAGLWLNHISPVNVLGIAVLSLSIVSDWIGQRIRQRWRRISRWLSRLAHRRFHTSRGTQG